MEIKRILRISIQIYLYIFSLIIVNIPFDQIVSGKTKCGIKVQLLNCCGTGVHIIQFIIREGIGVESTFRGMKVHFLCHCDFWQVFVYV